MHDDGQETMAHEWQERLSEYLDGDLTREERSACEAHLRACSACAGVLSGIQQVVEHAARLDVSPPETDLWPAIRAQLEAAQDSAPASGRRPRRFAWAHFSWPQLAAAGIAAAALAGTLLWAARERIETVRQQADVTAPSESVRSANSGGGDLALELREAEASIAELHTSLAGGRAGLDSSTVRVLEQNLALIETSISESRKALDADPGNSYLRDHLEDNIQGKLRLLRRAALIASLH